MPKFIDLTGQRFARLLVLHRDTTQPSSKNNGMYYLCLCDCGTTTSIPRNRLTTHNTQSCGCLKAEQKIHELGWDHPDVANPRRRELYAQKRAMGYVRVRSEAFYARQRARHQERRQENPEALRAVWNSASKTYRATHPAKVVANNKRFRERNPEYAHNYQQTHPEGQAVRYHRRRAKLLNAPYNDLTTQQWIEIKSAFNHCCAYCGIKSKRLSQDHITPLSKGGSHTANNVVPACRTCNSKKHAGPVLKPIQPLLFLIAQPKERNEKK
jgi:5-methylcytosine-specific restriction endonuclease McrA